MVAKPSHSIPLSSFSFISLHDVPDVSRFGAILFFGSVEGDRMEVECAHAVGGFTTPMLGRGEDEKTIYLSFVDTALRSRYGALSHARGDSLAYTSKGDRCGIMMSSNSMPYHEMVSTWTMILGRERMVT